MVEVRLVVPPWQISTPFKAYSTGVIEIPLTLPLKVIVEDIDAVVIFADNVPLLWLVIAVIAWLSETLISVVIDEVLVMIFP